MSHSEYKGDHGCGGCKDDHERPHHGGHHDKDDCPKTKDYFDFDYYRCFNPDVERVYGSDNVGLWKHFCNYGYSECRIHRFVKPYKVCRECCPQPCALVVQRCHVKYPDPSCPPCPPKACCPLPKLCCKGKNGHLGYAYVGEASGHGHPELRGHPKKHCCKGRRGHGHGGHHGGYETSELVYV
jgi:hypothetical protein